MTRGAESAVLRALQEAVKGAGAVFEIVREPREVVMQRSAPGTGTWAQWEAVWRRRVPVGGQPAMSAGVTG